jgi:NSS family neurotransmitter:Na+ symporter
MYYFYRFVTGNSADLGFAGMIANPGVNVTFMLIVVATGFAILCFNLQSGLERVTKYMMAALLVLMIILAINSATLSGAKEGLSFYLLPDFSKISPNVIVGAMNQAFFTLSLGIGSMAIFGSYLNKDRSLMGESVNVIVLDSFVAVTAGLIIFPACFTYDLEVGQGPGLLFDTMATVFNNMNGGRLWGTAFFLFMVFASMSTVLAVFENILACVREMFGWNRPKGCLACGILIAITSLTTALGYSVWPFHPFAEDTAWLDLWDFIVSYNLLPLGSLAFAIFCCNKRYGWGWENFLAEANTGKGLKVRNWMKPIFCYVVPVAVIVIYIIGLLNFSWK